MSRVSVRSRPLRADWYSMASRSSLMRLVDSGQRRSDEAGTWAIAKLHLRVQPPEVAEAFDVNQTTPIPLAELPDYAAGKTLAVRFDPASREVAVECGMKAPAP